MPQLTNTSAKAVAIGRDREPALHVIMHRISGALEYHGEPVHLDDYEPFIRAKKGRFEIVLVPDKYYVFFWVEFENSPKIWTQVLYGRICSDGSGKHMNGRVDVIKWDRCYEHRHWHADLLDTFPHDSDWLLNFRKVVRPEIVTAVLSHIAAQSIRPL